MRASRAWRATHARRHAPSALPNARLPSIPSTQGRIQGVSCAPCALARSAAPTTQSTVSVTPRATTPAHGAAAAPTVVRGTIQRVIFRSTDSKYAVVALRAEGAVAIPSSPSATLAAAREGTVVVQGFGSLAAFSPGERIEVAGSWTEHKTYGVQLRVTRASSLAPDSKEAVQRYLASGLFKGIGPVLAQRIVDRFGEGTLDVLREGRWEELAAVKGVSKKVIAGVRGTWESRQAAKDLVMFLQEHGIGVALAERLYQRFRGDALSVVQSDPYRICDVRSIGFLTADRVARQLGLAHNSDARLSSALLHALRAAAATSGHCCLLEPELVRHALVLLLPVDRRKGPRSPRNTEERQLDEQQGRRKTGGSALGTTELGAVSRASEGGEDGDNEEEKDKENDEVEDEGDTTASEEFEADAARRWTLAETHLKEAIALRGDEGVDLARRLRLCIAALVHRGALVADLAPASSGADNGGGESGGESGGDGSGDAAGGTGGYRAVGGEEGEADEDVARLSPEAFRRRVRLYLPIAYRAEEWVAQRLALMFRHWPASMRWHRRAKKATRANGEENDDDDDDVDVSDTRRTGLGRDEVDDLDAAQEFGEAGRVSMDVVPFASRTPVFVSNPSPSPSPSPSSSSRSASRPSSPPPSRSRSMVLPPPVDPVAEAVAAQRRDEAGRARLCRCIDDLGLAPAPVWIDLLSAEQCRAVEVALTEPVSLVLGGPGTGKTYVTRAIVELWTRQGRRVAVASPTARAAHRLNEFLRRDIASGTAVDAGAAGATPNSSATLLPRATTLHLLLEYGQRRDDGMRRPRDASALVEDENENEVEGEGEGSRASSSRSPSRGPGSSLSHPSVASSSASASTEDAAIVYPVVRPSSEGMVDYADGGDGEDEEDGEDDANLLDFRAGSRASGRRGVGRGAGGASAGAPDPAYDGSGGGGESGTFRLSTRYGRNLARPLETDAVLVDESSMVDLEMIAALLRALPIGSRSPGAMPLSLVFVGDPDQLPSVGAGRILTDLVDSGVLPTTHLTRIFRQAASSSIVRFAHSIHHGIPPVGMTKFPGSIGTGRRTPTSGSDILAARARRRAGALLSSSTSSSSSPSPSPASSSSLGASASRAGVDPSEDCLWLEVRDPTALANRVAGDVIDCVRAAGFDPTRDLQVLSPMRRGPMGTDALNRALQARLNPPPTTWTSASRASASSSTSSFEHRDVLHTEPGFPDEEEHRIIDDGVDEGLVEHEAASRSDAVSASPTTSPVASSTSSSSASMAAPVTLPFRVGDRVMQQRNDYQKGVVNGEVGVVERIAADGSRVTVRFEARLGDGSVSETVDYEAHEARRALGLAYAVTVHKAQGCEWPVTVVVLHPAHYVMLTRGLVYTALSRAQSLAILVGTRPALYIAVQNTRETERETLLAARLRRAVTRARAGAALAPDGSATTAASAHLANVWESLGVLQSETGEGVGEGMGEGTSAAHRGARSSAATVAGLDHRGRDDGGRDLDWSRAWDQFGLEEALLNDPAVAATEEHSTAGRSGSER